MLRRFFATSTLLALTAASALGQLGNIPMPNVEYNPLLLMNPSVHKELRLSPASASKVQSAFLEEAMKILPALTGGSGTQGKPPTTPQQRTKMTLDGINRMQNRLAAMLTPPQRARLRQLTLQSVGAAAVLQPKVAQGLGLTSAQRSKLTQSISDANERLAGGLANGRSPREWQSRMGEMARLQAQAKAAGDKALMATLTAPQKAKWKAMLGKPFPLSGLLGVGNAVPMMGR